MLTLIITNMEGTLWKWTNYFSGWQPRWFILDGGILSYYKSQEEVNTGCKGSIKMTVCDVVVHQTDNTRLDLIIPGEQHFYVKAATPQERQQWLVALGTAKACATNGRPPVDTGELSPDILRTKKSELRLYCDVLMQQVHAVKTAATSNNSPNVEQMDEATSLLSATCDTFILTLEDCMKLAHAKIDIQAPPPSMVISTVPPSPSRTAHKKSRNTVQRSNSGDSGRHRVDSQSSYSRQSSRSSLNSDRGQSESPQPSPKPSLHAIVDREDAEIHHNGGQLAMELDISLPKIPTFFNTMPYSFMDLKLQEDGGIPVEPYMACCQSLVPLFDCLNGTAFAPVKMDFTGNIKKIDEKYQSNKELFTCLQKMVTFEVSAKQYIHSSSATVAILWMKRSLEFIREILSEITLGEKDLSVAITNAYGKTLRHYHSWVVRGVFGLAVKAVPTMETFFVKLAVNEPDTEKPEYYKCLLVDIENYITAVDVVVKILQDFYTANNLDDDERV